MPLDRNKLLIIGGLSSVVILGLLYWWLTRCNPADDDEIRLSSSAKIDLMNSTVKLPLVEADSTMSECAYSVDDDSHVISVNKAGTFTYTFQLHQDFPGNHGEAHLDSWVNGVLNDTAPIDVYTSDLTVTGTINANEDDEIYWTATNELNPNPQSPVSLHIVSATVTYEPSG